MFQIGEFTKIAQVSGRLLRYYDKIGIFTPDYTDPQSGYRFYTAKQLPRLNRILALKELGLSLEQIHRLLDDDISVEEIRGMLTLKKAQVEQTLLTEMARFRYIESRIEQIDRQGHLANYDIVLKSVPALRYLSYRQVFDDLGAVQAFGVEMVRQLPRLVAKSQLEHIMVIIHADTWEDDSLDMEIGFLVHGNIESEFQLADGTCMILRDVAPLEYMLTLVRTGRPSLGHGHYSALGDWIDANHFRFAGYGRELFFQFPFPDKEHETIAEIQFPVEKLDTPPPRQF